MQGGRDLFNDFNFDFAFGLGLVAAQFIVAFILGIAIGAAWLIGS